MQGCAYHAPLLSPSRNTISAILSDNPTHIALQSQPYCHAIWLELAPNMAGVASQYGWDWTATRLKVSCL